MRSQYVIIEVPFFIFLRLNNFNDAIGRDKGFEISFKVEFKEAIDHTKLKNKSFVGSLKEIDKNIWLVKSQNNKDIREDIFRFAVDNKYNVLSLSQTEASLEDVFRKLTKE